MAKLVIAWREVYRSAFKRVKVQEMPSLALHQDGWLLRNARMLELCCADLSIETRVALTAHYNNCFDSPEAIHWCLPHCACRYLSAE